MEKSEASRTGSRVNKKKILAGANGSIFTIGRENGLQVVGFAEVSDPFYPRLLIHTLRKKNKKKHEEEVLFSMCEIHHSQFDKFSPWRWVTQATLSFFFVLFRHVGPPSGAESLHTSCRRRISAHILLAFQVR